MRKPRTTRILAAVIVLLAAPLPATASILYGPTPYTSFANSPFFVGTPSTFYLENFEDGALNTPGVTATTSAGVTWGVGGNAGHIDSVDGGNSGHSMGIGPSGPPAGTSTTTFTFNAGVLGQFQTHAGIVFTDIGISLTTQPENRPGDRNGRGFLTFRAFDPLGNLLGSIGPEDVGDYFKAGSTADDRFFGVFDSGGISRIEIFMDSHDAEFDHLQYGFTPQVTAEAPEPASLLVWTGLGLVAVPRTRPRWLSRLGRCPLR